MLGAAYRVLDWFHISMHLRPVEQMSPVIASFVGDADPMFTDAPSEAKTGWVF